MLNLLLQLLAVIAIAVMGLALLGLLLSPIYVWLRWRDTEMLAEARSDGLID